MIAYHSIKQLQDAIKAQITSNDNQAIKAMLRIFEYQTEDEQYAGTVSEFNGVGFVGVDAEILTSFCQQYQKKGYLSPKQIAIIRGKIGKYAGQLVRHAINKGIYVKQNNYWVIAA